MIELLEKGRASHHQNSAITPTSSLCSTYNFPDINKLRLKTVYCVTIHQSSRESRSEKNCSISFMRKICFQNSFQPGNDVTERVKKHCLQSGLINRAASRSHTFHSYGKTVGKVFARENQAQSCERIREAFSAETAREN